MKYIPWEDVSRHLGVKERNLESEHKQERVQEPHEWIKGTTVPIDVDERNCLCEAAWNFV